MTTRQPCTCRRPLKMGGGLNCGYCGGRLRRPAVPAVPAAAVARNPMNAPTDVHDATKHPDIHELPAQTTFMDPNQFQEWINSPGKIFIIYLPDRKSFVIKVTDEHHDFFVAMVKQLRMTLGPEVQAAAAIACDAPPPPGDPDTVLTLDDSPPPAPFMSKLPPIEYKPDPPSPLIRTSGGYQIKPRGDDDG